LSCLRLLMIVVAVLAAGPLHAKAPKPKHPEVKAQPIPFNPQDPSDRRAGRLTYLGGLQLSSDHWMFGGFSGLEISADGTRLLAISDRGVWWTARLATRDGVPVDVADNVLMAMSGADGQVLPAADHDAEGLMLVDGDALVSFERNHRIERYPTAEPDDIAGVTRSRPEPVPVPVELRGAPPNGGVEALTTLADGSLFALTEEMPGADGHYRGWLGRGGRWQPFDYTRTDPYKPTDAARLPNGDVLVIERRFSMLGGVGARVCIVPAAGIGGHARLVCETVAEMAPPRNIDNMEGVAVRVDEHGDTLVYLISDDNFSRLQRTLLLVFRLEPAAR
jgi:hypothetical protein